MRFSKYLNNTFVAITCVFNKHDSGFSLVELLVGLLVSSILLLSASTQFVSTSRVESDQLVKLQTQEDARVLLDAIAFDLRMIGAGMPLQQEDFAMDDVSLGDKPLPVMLNATSRWIQYRANDRGISTFLTQDFSPSWANRTFTVVDASLFKMGGAVYIVDNTTGGEQALTATIASIAGNEITINADYLPTFAMTMPSGSVVNAVTLSVLISHDTSKEIYKVDTMGGAKLATGATFTLDYLDKNGVSLALPLTEQVVRDDLTAINLTVSLESGTPLRGGGNYVATANQKIALRNLILSR